MKRILIADSSKASLVMTSEVFKDHYPGIQVLVARNSAEAITLAKSTDNIDAFIVDFDLPDINGAQTALLLKKISKIPILITAFDKVEVVEMIETLLIKYDDCRSWLKKPVNPEVVIAVAQRYCDGKIRAQKRILCQLPALAKMDLKRKTKKTKITKINSEKIKEVEPLSLYFHGIIEDCSLSGVKLKPSKNTANGLTEWARFLENIENISSGSPVTLKVPPFLDIEIGKISELSKTQISKLEKDSKSRSGTKNKLQTTKVNSKKMEEENSQDLNGKVVWTSSDSGEWCMGIEFEDQGLSKRLFEAIVSLQSRQHKASQSQSIMKTSRIA